MPLLRVEGEVEKKLDLSFEDLSRLPGQIADVSALIAGREGGGVQLKSILEKAGLKSAARFMTLKASDNSFAASVPLEQVANGIVCYRLGSEALPVKKGGPVRFFLDPAATCKNPALDGCANVKFLSSIRLTKEPGEDTRPSTKRAHEGLHEKPGHEHLK